jgi:hypothetical protein
MTGMLARVPDQNMRGGGWSLERTALQVKLPANREFNREILRFRPSLTQGATPYATRFAVLSSRWPTTGAKKEQGIFSRYQGI